MTSETLYSFFLAQLKESSRLDWVIQTHRDFEDFGINRNLLYLEAISKYSFKNLVKERAKYYALRVYKNMQIHHSKMMSIHYNELKMQNYFNDKNLSTAEKLTVFRWRIHMEKVFDGNFRAGRKQVMCVCGAHTDKQRITWCTAIKPNPNMLNGI